MYSLCDSHPVLHRCHACLFLEEAAEVLRILEAQLIADLRDALLHVCQSLLDGIQRAELDVLLRRLACLFLDKVTKIVGGEAEFGGAVFHGRQTAELCVLSLEILVQKLLETGEKVGIDRLTGNELTLVEAQTVVEQYLYV